MKKIKMLSIGSIFAFTLLSSQPAEAKCRSSNYVANGHLYLVQDCYFLGIRYSHTVTDMGPFVLD
jgi:hypothetical protein